MTKTFGARLAKIRGLTKSSSVAWVLLLTLWSSKPGSVAQSSLAESTRNYARVGQQDDKSYVVATGQRISPAGTQVEFFGRPVDMALSPRRDLLAIKNSHGLVVVGLSTKRLQALNFMSISPDYIPHLGGASFTGIAWENNGRNIWITDAYVGLHCATLQSDGTFRWTRHLSLPGPSPSGQNTPGSATSGSPSQNIAPSSPGGIAIGRDDRLLYVTLSQNNALGIVDLSSGKLVGNVPTGVTPYTVLLSGRRAFVSNWGGRIPKPGESTSPSAGTPTLVDSNGVASSGTVSVIDLERGLPIAEIEVGLHPSGMAMAPDGRRLFVANANSDSVSVIDTALLRQVQRLSVHAGGETYFGSEPNSLALDAAGKTLYVSNGGDNAVAVFDLPKLHLRGFIPVAWYPGALVVDDTKDALYVANVKGEGDLGIERGYAPNYIRRRKGGKNAYDYSGSVTIVPVPDESTLRAMTQQVRENRAYMSTGGKHTGTGAFLVCLPASAQQQSVFKHVIYIIKENRTYDEILGDMRQGNGDSHLCMFCGDVTPNHHALAEQFVLLDNFYVNGLLSADGHQWTDEGIASDYVEKSMGGFSRSYPSDGTDPLAYSPAGFIWDAVLRKGLSFRNYGEFVESELITDPKNASWNDFYSDYLHKTRKNKFHQRIYVRALREHTSPDYPPFGLTIPDVYRAQRFLEDFAWFEASGSLPNLILLQLGNDHTSGLDPGLPSPRSAVADNDLALGQIVDAVSHSRYWHSTLILVVEDDAQDGLDHVDGRRSMAFAISAYTQRHVADHHFYNQNTILRAIERIFALPPLTAFDSFSAQLDPAFTMSEDRTPYSARANRVPLDEINPELKSLEGSRREFAEVSSAMDFSHPDRVDEGQLNRVLWFATHGAEEYPEGSPERRPGK